MIHFCYKNFMPDADMCVYIYVERERERGHRSIKQSAEYGTLYKPGAREHIFPE